MELKAQSVNMSKVSVIGDILCALGGTGPLWKLLHAPD